MAVLPLSPRILPVVFRAVAVVCLLATLVGATAVWALLGQAESALEDSLALTADTLAALDASAGVAADAIEALATSLAALERTATDLDGAFDDGELLLVDLADVVREDVASSLAAVDDALPGLIRVGATIDSTLSALSGLPFGPAYDPAEDLATALTGLSTSIDGLPDRLRSQADMIEASSANLAVIGQGVSDLVGDLAGFEASLEATSALLATYDTTIGDGQALVAEAQAALSGRIAFARVGVVLVALAFAAFQIVPLHLAAASDAGNRALGAHHPA